MIPDQSYVLFLYDLLLIFLSHCLIKVAILLKLDIETKSLSNWSNLQTIKLNTDVNAGAFWPESEVKVSKNGILKVCTKRLFDFERGWC